jgi:hypothetical protein
VKLLDLGHTSLPIVNERGRDDARKEERPWTYRDRETFAPRGGRPSHAAAAVSRKTVRNAAWATEQGLLVKVAALVSCGC